MPKVRGNLQVRGSVEGGRRRMAHFRDSKADGTNAGTLTTNTWNTRTLNTTLRNDIGASLGSNRITLPAGSWFIEAGATQHECERFKARIQNITAGTTAIVGTSMNSPNGGAKGQIALVRGLITLSVSSQIELQLYITNATPAASEGGQRADDTDGGAEVYSEVIVTSYNNG